MQIRIRVQCNVCQEQSGVDVFAPSAEAILGPVLVQATAAYIVPEGTPRTIAVIMLGYVCPRCAEG